MTRDEWLKMRQTGIGSSDLPIIMGLSPWKTPLELWKEKTGRTPLDSVPNFVQQHGIDMEPRARAAYELLQDMDLPAQFVRHPEYPFLVASLDGWNAEHRRILEIKCPLFSGDHEVAKAGRVPEKYEVQVRHQLMVTEAETADYFSYFKPKPEIREDYALVRIQRDMELEIKLFDAALWFWRLIETDTPPPLTARDFKELLDPAAVELFERWKKAKQAGDKKLVEQLRNEIKPLLDHPKVLCAGVKAETVQRQTGATVALRWTEEVES